MKVRRITIALLCPWIAMAASAQPLPTPTESPAPVVTLVEDNDTASLRFNIDGAEAFTYQFGQQYALPHVWPLRSPTGQSMLVQHPDPYPHHRSLWLADKVQVDDGPIVDFYHHWKNYRDADRPEKGHKSFIRQTSLEQLDAADGEAHAIATLEWVIEEDTIALRESRSFHLTALGNGEYLLDLEWTLTAADGDVTFHSDWVHYAWPFVRIDPVFSGDQGGTIEDDQGRQGQKATNEQYANWIDYSNKVDGETSGVAVLLMPSEEPRKWLTREYGTFGPRRVDSMSGTGFVLKQGESLKGRAGILVHRGNATTGRIAERYNQYVKDAHDGD